MKKTMLWGALFTIMCTPLHAESTQTPDATTNTTVNVQPAQTPTVTNQTAQPTQIQTNTDTQQVQPGNTQNQNPQVQPTTQPVAVEPAPVIDCDYKIPASTKVVDQTLVLTWSQKAVTQAFDFDPMSIDAQLQKLQNCFTDQGWAGFNSALQKSGNLEAIKSQKLTVSSQVEGSVLLNEAKDNQWKISMPLQVVYQNDKEKVTQLLNVDVTVSRKITGDLGITQMIATPRGTVDMKKASDTTVDNDAATGTPVSSAPSDVTNTTTSTPAATGTGTGTTSTPSN